MIHKLLDSEDGGDYYQLFEALSRMTATFLQAEHPPSYKLHNEICGVVKRIKEDRIVLYNVIDL